MTAFRLLVLLVLWLQLPLSLGQNNSGHNQTQQLTEQEKKMLQVLREKMRQDHEMMNRILNDSLFSSLGPEMSQRFRGLLNNFSQGNNGFYDDFLNDPNFAQFFKHWSGENHFEKGDSDWVETESERILTLKLESPKDSPLNIKIEKGLIEISGKLLRREKNPGNGASVEEIEFQKIFPVPSDCDGASAQLESVDGTVKIKLKKLYKKVPQQSIQHKNPSNKPKVRQLTPKKGDINL